MTGHACIHRRASGVQDKVGLPLRGNPDPVWLIAAVSRIFLSKSKGIASERQPDLGTTDGFQPLAGHWLLIALAAFSVMGCASLPPRHFADAKPAFDPMAYFTGHTHSWGVFENRAGNPSKRFATDCTGHREGDTLVLDQTFTYDDGRTQQRHWRIRRVSAHRYEATANDVGRHRLGRGVRKRIPLGIHRRARTRQPAVQRAAQAMGCISRPTVTPCSIAGQSTSLAWRSLRSRKTSNGTDDAPI